MATQFSEQDVHVDQALTNFALQYKNGRLIADMVMPRVKVTHRSDKYYVYSKADAYRIPDDSVGPKDMPNETGLSLSTDNYSVDDRALSDYVPLEAQENADEPLNPRMDTVAYLQGMLWLAREKRVADIAFADASYPVGNKKTLAGTARWGGTTADPIADVQQAIAACFMSANTLVFGLEAWQVFRRSSDILDAVNGATRHQDSAGGLARRSDIADLFEVDNVLVGDAREITNNAGQDPTYGRIWGKHFAALYVDPNPGIKTLTFGATYCEQKDMLVQTAIDYKRGVKGAEYIKVGWNGDEKVVANDVGYLIRNAVA